MRTHALTGCLGVVVGAGLGAAAVQVVHPAQEPVVPAPPPPAPAALVSEPPFPTNALGMTYGAGTALRPEGGPDLVSAYATNGRRGFVRAADVVLPPPTSRAGALSEADPGRTIPVHAVDGTTVVGVFTID